MSRGSFASGFLGKTHQSLRTALHQVSWPLAAGSALVGYYAGNALTSLGWGNILYQRSPQYAAIVDAGWAAVNDLGIPSDQNPWGNGGLVAVMKTGGLGYWGKKLYDFEKGKKPSRGEMNFGLPFALGAVLDPPAVTMGIQGTPYSGGGVGSTGLAPMVSQGGVSW